MKKPRTINVGFLRAYLLAQKQQHESALVGWDERDGYLKPTEPDPDERDRVRDRLDVAIKTLEKVDDYICDVLGIDEESR